MSYIWQMESKIIFIILRNRKQAPGKLYAGFTVFNKIWKMKQSKHMLLTFLVDSEWGSIISALKDAMEIQNNLEGNGQF